MDRSVMLFALAMVGGCAPAQVPAQAGPQEAPTPAPAVARHTVKGRVDAIRFQNINKAAGRFSYNVELTVALTSVQPTPESWTASPNPAPERLRVRIHQSLGWRTLSAAEQQALAPDGPTSVLTPTTWRGYKVGEDVEVDVRMTGFDLAHTD